MSLVPVNVDQMQVFLMIEHWNSDKARYECKELFGIGRCDDGFLQNLSTCEYKCDESCDLYKEIGTLATLRILRLCELQMQKKDHR